MDDEGGGFDGVQVGFPAQGGGDGGEVAGGPGRVQAAVVVFGGAFAGVGFVEGPDGAEEEVAGGRVLVDVGVPAGGGGVSRALIASIWGRGRAGSPVEELRMVRVRTRCGWRRVNIWAIMPPMETPMMCAVGMPRASSRPAASSAMSCRV